MTFTRKRKIIVWLKDDVVEEDDNAILYMLDHNSSIQCFKSDGWIHPLPAIVGNG